MEHGHHSDEQVAQMCAIARQLDWVLMIRPNVDRYDSSAAQTLRKAMDLGCSGLVLPNIESAKDLDCVRDAIWLPPRGTRRPGGPANYWVPDFQYDTMRSLVEDNFLVLPMIESGRGVENIQEIAEHEVVTHLDIGPYDLCLSLGLDYYVKRPPEDDDLQKAVDLVRAAAESCGKTLLGTHGTTEELLEQGYHFLGVGEPTALLRDALTAANDRAKGRL